MAKKRGLLTQLVRHLVQLAAFILFPGLFISVFSAVRDLVTAFAESRFSFGGLFPQIILVFAVFLITALWGRFFCGFLCSFGMLQELLFFFSRRTLFKKARMPERFDAVMKYLKYGIHSSAQDFALAAKSVKTCNLCTPRICRDIPVSYSNPGEKKEETWGKRNA